MTTDNEISELVKSSLQAKIIQAFHDAPEAIDKLVSAALEKPVDPDTGNANGYSHRRVPYLEWLVGETIRNVARDAVQEAVKRREEDIRAAIMEKVTAPDLVEAMMKAVLGATERSAYKIKVNFVGERD